MDTTLTTKEFIRYMQLSERIFDKMANGKATDEESREWTRIESILRKFRDNQYKPLW